MTSTASRRSRLSGRFLAGIVAAVALVALCLGAQLVPSTSAGFSAKVTNTNQAGTARDFTCADSITSERASALFAYPLGDLTGSAVTDTSGNARTGTLYGTRATTTDRPCPRDAGMSATFNGMTNWISTPYKFATAPNVFSLEAWIKTTVKGGKIIGFGTAQTTISSQFDRHIYINTSGQAVFGVYNNGTQVITSSASVADGSWHHVVATLSTAGMYLYVDGAQVASNPAMTTGETTSGWWHIGYDSLSGWPNAAPNYFFTGSMRYVAVYTAALTSAQVKAHYISGITPANS
ncbi:MAG: LamG domain-containing protein [Lacisediminihabitans sp.]